MAGRRVGAGVGDVDVEGVFASLLAESDESAPVCVGGVVIHAGARIGRSASRLRNNRCRSSASSSLLEASLLLSSSSSPKASAKVGSTTELVVCVEAVPCRRPPLTALLAPCGDCDDVRERKEGGGELGMVWLGEKRLSSAVVGVVGKFGELRRLLFSLSSPSSWAFTRAYRADMAAGRSDKPGVVKEVVMCC